MKWYLSFFTVAVIIWGVGLLIWSMHVKFMPMLIHDYYFYYPKIEELRGFSVSLWKTDSSVGEGEIVYRDCEYDSTFYYFKFKQEKLKGGDDDAYSVLPFDVEDRKKGSAVIWATVLGSALYFLLYSVVFWGILITYRKLSRRKSKLEI